MCNFSEESRGHYAKWNTPCTERKILHDLTYLWNLKQLKLTEAENRMVIARAGGEEDGEMVAEYTVVRCMMVSSGDLKHNNVTTVNTVHSAHFKCAKRVDLKCSHHTHTKENSNHVRWYMLIRLIMSPISPCILKPQVV